MNAEGSSSLLGPVSIRGLTALLERLPAAQRAQFAWAPVAGRQELSPLIEGNLEPQAIANAAKGVMRILTQVLPGIFDLLGDLTPELDAAYGTELGRLSQILPDVGSKRSAEWVTSVLRVVSRVAVRHAAEITQIATSEVVQNVPDELANHEAGWLFEGMILLMAAMLIADEAGSPERAAELCDLAFLRTSRALDYLARGGLEFDLSEIDRKAGAGVLEAFDEARRALSGEDIDVLSSARLRQLR
jgi:hypothetical protein